MIVWITGLSGAGKTTLGTELQRQWKSQADNVVMVDGDVVRRLLGAEGTNDAYTMEARRKVAERIAEICAWLDEQGMHVVCCTISMFPELRRRNRERFSRYFEVFVDAPMEALERRHPDALYDRAARGEVANVVGVDIAYEKPENPDFILDNRGDGTDFAQVARDLLGRMAV